MGVFRDFIYGDFLNNFRKFFRFKYEDPNKFITNDLNKKFKKS